MIILPMVAIGWFGWSMYMRAVNIPDHAAHNLLQGGDFEDRANGGVPSGWTVKASDTLSYFPQPVKGYGGGKALQLVVDTYTGGSLDVESPLVQVQPATTYFYKGYYRSTVPFWLLAKFYYKDGTSKLKVVKQYGDANDWTTDSLAFLTDANTQRVQFYYKLAAKGELTVDKAFVEKRADGSVYLPDTPTVTTTNILANGDLADQQGDTPVGWGRYYTGNNSPELSYIQQDGSRYLRVRLSNYKDGEAKWEHKPLDSEGGQYLSLTLDYRCDTTVAQLVAEYVMEDGSRSFATLANLPPASNWTSTTVYAEAPEGAKTVALNAVLKGGGTLDTDNYRVDDLTKPGIRHFKRPLVSISFDDGWESGYNTAARIMDYLNYKGTFYINPAAVEEPAFLTGADLQSLIKSGNQLATEGNEYVDLTTLNTRLLKRQLLLAHDYFVKQLHQTNIDFAPTSGYDDAGVQALTHTYFRSSRGGGDGINTKQNFDAYNLKTFYVDNKTNPQRLQAVLDETQRMRGWLILVYHRVEDNSPSRTTVTSKEFTDQMEQLHKSGIAVTTVGKAIDEILGQ